MLLTFSNSQNQMDSYQYDSAGNLLNDGFRSYTYDAENRIIGVDSGGTTYAYDANGERIQKISAGVDTEFLHDVSGNTITALTAQARGLVLRSTLAGDIWQLIAVAVAVPPTSFRPTGWERNGCDFYPTAMWSKPAPPGAPHSLS
jgi:YD repeat-containing protein